MPVKYVKGKGETNTEVHLPDGTIKQKKGETTESMVTDGTLVYCKLGHTKNLGNYESIRMEVGVTLPTTLDNMQDSWAMAQTWCDLKLTELVHEVEEEVGEG